MIESDVSRGREREVERGRPAVRIFDVSRKSLMPSVVSCVAINSHTGTVYTHHWFRRPLLIPASPRLRRMANLLRVGTDFPAIDVYLNAITVSLPCSRGGVASAPGVGHGNVASALGAAVTAPFRALLSAAATPLVEDATAPLRGITCSFRAGSATCILSAPGGGASTLLRLLSGRIPANSGAVTYNGAHVGALGGDAQIKKLAVYGGADDVHETFITVSEVLDFAYKAAVVPGPAGTPGNANKSAPGTWSPPTPEQVIASFGLGRANDTIAGGMLNRGLSGGEKRRLSVAEAFIGNSRVLALDHPTDGLDSAVALNVVTTLVDWAHATRGVLVAALQQPTPEALATFDDVLLLVDGRVLYHGPVPNLDGYLASVGYVRPSYSELAEWAVELLCNPAHAASASVEDRFGSQKGSGAAAAPREGDASIPWQFTTEELANTWEASPQFAATHGTSGGEGGMGGVVLSTPYAVAQYGRPHARAFLAQLLLVLKRELLVTSRNWVYIGARVVLCSVMVRGEDDLSGDTFQRNRAPITRACFSS